MPPGASSVDIYTYMHESGRVSPGSSTPTAADACDVELVDPDKVVAARLALISETEAVALSEVFRLLGDPTRARVLYALLEAGEMCVCDLAATVDVPQPKVSQGLRLLRHAGIVKNRRSGRMVYYSLADGHVRMILDLSREHLRHEDVA